MKNDEMQTICDYKNITPAGLDDVIEGEVFYLWPGDTPGYIGLRDNLRDNVDEQFFRKLDIESREDYPRMDSHSEKFFRKLGIELRKNYPGMDILPEELMATYKEFQGLKDQKAQLWEKHVAPNLDGKIIVLPDRSILGVRPYSFGIDDLRLMFHIMESHNIRAFVSFYDLYGEKESDKEGLAWMFEEQRLYLKRPTYYVSVDRPALAKLMAGVTDGDRIRILPEPKQIIKL